MVLESCQQNGMVLKPIPLALQWHSFTPRNTLAMLQVRVLTPDSSVNHGSRDSARLLPVPGRLSGKTKHIVGRVWVGSITRLWF